jgi:hypothetical protein
VTLELYADLLRYTGPGDRSALAEKLAKARCDEDRLTVLRENAARLGAIIGTSRYWCAAWWADVVAPDYVTLAEAETELEAAVIVATRLADHRTTVPAPKNWTIGER